MVWSWLPSIVATLFSEYIDDADMDVVRCPELDSLR